VASERIIEADDLRYDYPGGVSALRGLTFTVSAGESVGLVGPNGAGKTTLFLVLAGVLAARARRLCVAGLDPRDPVQRRRLPTQLGIVFQNSDDQLFSTTVYDDVAFGPLNLGLPADEVRRRVVDALAEVGLTGLEQRVPYHLSGGERRRAALAGVLAMRPSILLLDEPTMYLDPRGRRELLALVQRLGSTKLIASHDLEMILRTCNRVLVLDHGQLVANGPPRELLADAELMDKHGLEVPYSLKGGSSP
jgi:cobalt/nickel transport system ATP-binding protein